MALVRRAARGRTAEPVGAGEALMRGMRRSYTDETREAAVRDCGAGIKVPVICQRYGISERTLTRWNRQSARARAERGVSLRAEAGAAEVARGEDALRIVAALLPLDLHDRAVRALESRLGITRGEARRILGLCETPAAGSTRVGMPVVQRTSQTPLANDFGKSRWLAVHEHPGRLEFLSNPGLSGVSAAAALGEAGCRDVIALHLGARAQERLASSGIRMWRGREGVPARELVAALARGELEPWPSGLVALTRPRSR
ncbi:MAG: transposase [Anaeromyxobacteraceae bacterium]